MTDHKPTAAEAPSVDSRMASDAVTFICGVRNVEDLLLLPKRQMGYRQRIQLGQRHAKLFVSF
jgi:hypothetical protein